MTLRAHTGLAVRLVMRSYVLSVGFVMFALLVVALSIDLTKVLDSLRNKAANTDTALWRVLLPYSSYRAVDIVTRLLGTACVIGGFLATLLRHQRREDVVLAAAGMSPRFHFTALIATAVLFGSIQFGFQNWLRPAAVSAQIEAQLGRYGSWFGRTELTNQWILGDDIALLATVNRGENAGLQNLRVFEGLSAPTLTRLIEARSAYPDQDSGKWVLENATVWTDANGFVPTVQETVLLPLPLNAASLEWYEVHGFYLPNRVAREVAKLTGTTAASDAATTLAFRKMALFLPGILILLGGSLAQIGISGRQFNAPRLLALAAAGYLTVVVVKSFWILGINGRIAPQLAATLPLAIAFVIGCLLQLHHAGYLLRPKSLPQRHDS
ncbi:MAG: LptF/LptG family permease [Shimia sp.]|nr:LptF/LptG family permease [Shimia sp.]